MEGHDSLLKRPEVAALLRISPKTVLRWGHTGKLTVIRLPGGQLRYREAEVRALLAHQEGALMDDDVQFARWFLSWKHTRPDTSPLGWYDIHELQAAFIAGKSAEFNQAVADIIARSDRLEALLRGQAAADDRPGPTPPAGPVPA